MTDTTWTPNEEVRLAEYLAGQVCGRASGRLKTECWANAQRDTYFIGSLRPADDNVAEVSGRISPELLSKLAPSALGMELRLRPDEASFTVSVDISWACYYRIWPTHTQQLTHQRGVQQPISGAAAEEVAEEDSNSQDESGEARLVED